MYQILPISKLNNIFIDSLVDTFILLHEQIISLVFSQFNHKFCVNVMYFSCSFFFAGQGSKPHQTFDKSIKASRQSHQNAKMYGCDKNVYSDSDSNFGSA